MGFLRKMITLPFKGIKKGIEKIEGKKGVDKETKEEIKKDFVADVGYVLIDWGIEQKNAINIADEIFEKHKDKIFEALE